MTQEKPETLKEEFEKSMYYILDNDADGFYLSRRKKVEYIWSWINKHYISREATLKKIKKLHKKVPNKQFGVDADKSRYSILSYNLALDRLSDFLNQNTHE